jgi:hypothetical protein
MIEGYFKKGVVLTDYDFKDAGVSSAPLSEVSQGIKAGGLTVTETKTGLICCCLGQRESQVDFRFLPYAEGAINYCESMGVDVLSGYFSGCIMAIYRRNGSTRVCHVSTGGNNDCKETWERIKKESSVQVVREFKPSDHAPSPKTLGLVTATGDCYAIACTPQNSSSGQMPLRVDAIVKVAA